MGKSLETKQSFVEDDDSRYKGSLQYDASPTTHTSLVSEPWDSVPSSVLASP